MKSDFDLSVVVGAAQLSGRHHRCERFGRRKVMLVSVGGFVLASALCGQSSTLTQMVLSRLLQGVYRRGNSYQSVLAKLDSPGFAP